MTVEEVESAIEQIGVTSGLSQSVLNDDATYYLLSGETTLNSGIPLPFHSQRFQGKSEYYILDENVNVNKYKIKYDEYTGYLYAKYLVKTDEESKKVYDGNGIQEYRQTQHLCIHNISAFSQNVYKARQKESSAD